MSGDCCVGLGWVGNVVSFCYRCPHSSPDTVTDGHNLCLNAIALQEGVSAFPREGRSVDVTLGILWTTRGFEVILFPCLPWLPGGSEMACTLNPPSRLPSSSVNFCSSPLVVPVSHVCHKGAGSRKTTRFRKVHKARASLGPSPQVCLLVTPENPGCHPLSNPVLPQAEPPSPQRRPVFLHQMSYLQHAGVKGPCLSAE